MIYAVHTLNFLLCFFFFSFHLFIYLFLFSNLYLEAHYFRIDKNHSVMLTVRAVPFQGWSHYVCS